MNAKIEEVLAKFVTDSDSLLDEILKKLQPEKSKVIEVIGPSGSGKTSIFRKVIELFEEQKADVHYYLSRLFQFNQFKDLIQLITDISDKDLEELIQESHYKGIEKKYDFFYFITEQLSKKKLIKPRLIAIYESFILDSYCLDFIQYFVHYSDKIPVKFILFSRKEALAFSDKIELPIPTSSDIRQMLKEVYPDNSETFTSDAEILENISKGNLSLIEYFLANCKISKKKIDFSAFLDKKMKTGDKYRLEFEKLPPQQQELIFNILLLDMKASSNNLKMVYRKEPFTKNLNTLIRNGIVIEKNEQYFTKKATTVKAILSERDSKKQKEILKRITPIIGQNISDQILIMLKQYTVKILTRVLEDVAKLHDFDSVIKLGKILLDTQPKPEEKVEMLTRLGKVSRILGKNDSASEYYRRALKICTDNSLPADDVVYYLARCLNSIGSSAFALEIMKKYSPTPQNEFMQCKILLLKADILQEMENYEEAIENAEEAYQISDKIKDSSLQFQIKADYFKSLGKIDYYGNEWNKAQREFEEAEKFYSKIDDKEGLAAVYNNLGVIAMYQSDIKAAETLHFKSIKLEESRFNLSGMSTSYCNLGYLYEEKSDYNKSMKYLQEALRLQILLGDQYTIANIYMNIGVTYMDNNKFEKAEEAYNNSLEIAIEFNLHKNIINCYNNLGALFFRSGNFKTAIDYYERAVKKSKDQEFKEGMISSYINIGELFEKRGEYNLALDYYEKAKELLPNITDDLMKAILYGNLGSVLTQLHKFKDAYAYLVESIDFFKSTNQKSQIIEGCHKHAIYFIFTRNYESANYYLDQAFKLSEELESDLQIGKCYYIKALLEKDNPDAALESLKLATEKFVKSKDDFELALTNFEYASLLLEKEDWEQALQILTENKKIITKFEAIKFLERNDLLIQKIHKRYEKEVKESKIQESMLNKFYEITQQLNDISDFDTLLDTALDQLVNFAEADGGIFVIYNNEMVKDSWEYLILNNFSNRDSDFSLMMDIVQETYNEGNSINHKQPHFAAEYNNIISYPLTVRNEKKGVICLFTKRGSHYFTEKMFNLISALCNQIVVIVENISYEKLQKAHEIIRKELATASTFTNIIGKSEKIQDIFRMIEKIKNAPTTVLLEGSSGTGKELIARAIHYNSNRRNKQFVAQYCGALPETLLESELFGHVKGSFTGASHDKKGLFEVADGGTFFLDEIADISLSTQAKLLRFLQEGEIKRVGSTNTQHVDVRVICATNVSLREKVENGEFRLDLFYRLNVIRMEVPSLKERKSDIPLLAVHFLDKYCRKLDKEINGITEEAMKYMMNYDWPGNIRQLENELERAITLSDGDNAIKSSDLSPEIFRFQDNQKTVQLLEKRSLKDAVEDLEKQMIVSVLNETDWNQTQAAKKLGLSRQGLIKKMQRYRLER
jgi:transcriptional regulator with GAF, ATPase, and Fis domain/tetratricopeptide (TPR) repeat protein